MNRPQVGNCLRSAQKLCHVIERFFYLYVFEDFPLRLLLSFENEFVTLSHFGRFKSFGEREK